MDIVRYHRRMRRFFRKRPPEEEDTMAEVKIKSGWISGVEGDGYYGFMGIPYAAPPVGELRWKHPQPAESWEGVRRCVEPGRPCCQAPSTVVPGGDPDNRGVIDNGQEDCLYINVFTPDLKKEKLPVFFWIHGGAYCCGSGGGHNLNFGPFVKKGIVYVSFNYRVGIMGFFAHPELSAENPHHVSGNYGHYDQLAALRWVKENIAAFGGDPDNITIGGSSAGAGSSQILCNSPLAEGLMQKAIIISSLNIAPANYSEKDKLVYMKDMEDRGVEYMHLLGCESLADLRKLSYEQLIDHPLAAFRRKYHYGTSIGTNIDGYLITTFHKDGNVEGTNADIPYICGCTNDEGGEHILRMGKDRYIQKASEVFKDKTDEYLAIANIVDDASAGQAARDTHLKFAGTKVFAEHSAQLGKKPVYVYDFKRKNPDLGYANHGATTKYMFGSHTSFQNASPDDDIVAETLQGYWTNFIRTGDPNGEGLPEWKPYTRDERYVCYIDTETKVLKDEEAENPVLRFTREYLEGLVM